MKNQEQLLLVHKMYNQRGFTLVYLLLGLILVAFLGGAYYFGKLPIKPTPQVSVTPTPEQTQDETANWKIYTNERIRYSVDYPQNWFVYERIDDQKNQFSTDIQDIKDPEKPEDYTFGGMDPPNSTIFNIYNVPFDNSQRLELNDWIKTSKRYISISEKRLIQISNSQALFFATTNGNGAHFYIALIPSDNKIYEVSLIGPAKNKDLLLKILSTFKFTD